nr:immunoglobulin heavy chain junction region [Macaca mulatta]MOV88327.1 immunoglobulin heavy chain junction region [Macaca mulatta]MOV89155.1 immunoglobulin heavy chain junction region [Macaca mulatta]MOV89513.1 immunoglobulin heavy chain junction region [Macaca mulatta]MOV90281.1 immunoglobulin heavy chain junction region [Macaca mulatta]
CATDIGYSYSPFDYW